jgi:hypothetical protein
LTVGEGRVDDRVVVAQDLDGEPGHGERIALGDGVDACWVNSGRDELGDDLEHHAPTAVSAVRTSRVSWRVSSTLAGRRRELSRPWQQASTWSITAA